MFHSLIPFFQANGLLILAALVLAVTIVCWVLGSRRDKSAADRILIDRGLRKDHSFTKQVNELLKRELKQQKN